MPPEKTEQKNENGLPEAFNTAMDEIESAKEAETSADTTPAGDTKVEDETLQTDELEDSSEDSTEVEETELSEEDTEVLNGIDPDVLDTCRDYGWDDAKIVQMAQISPELFDDIREILDEKVDEDTKPSKEERQAATEKEKIDADELKFNLDADIVGEDVKNAIDKMATMINQQRKGLSEEQQKLQTERDTVFNERIDNIFDGHSKGYPALGNTSKAKLSRASQELRADVYAVASALSLRKGIPVERTMSRAINLFKNQGGKKQATKEIIDKLDKQEKRFTNPPTRRKSADTRPKFEDGYEEAEYRMAKAEQEAGLV
jgi:hypothetical protein